MQKEKHPVTVQYELEDYEEVRLLAFKRKISIPELIRRISREEIRKEKKKEEK